MEDGSDLGTCRSQVTSVGDLPVSSVSAPQLIPETLGSGPTPPVWSSSSCIRTSKSRWTSCKTEACRCTGRAP
eukprot:scaffold63395_cov46-Phaeocystis_antarctica.AAC.2